MPLLNLINLMILVAACNILLKVKKKNQIEEKMIDGDIIYLFKEETKSVTILFIIFFKVNAFTKRKNFIWSYICLLLCDFDLLCH